MSGLDLLLVNPGGTRKAVYQNISKAHEPPSWSALTAGFIRKQGYNVDILDASVLGLDYPETITAIKKADPKIIGIPVYGQQANTSSPLMTGIGNLCKLIKQEDDRPLVLSGWHPSALPERTIKEEVCDFVFEGEGFYSYLAMLQGKPNEQIPGLWWRQNNDPEDIHHNPRAPNIADLTQELDTIAWDLLPMDKYTPFTWIRLDHLKDKPRYASLYTSVGCPHKCTFCAIHSIFDERRMRFWKPEWGLGQIDHLVEKYNILDLKINDELFISKRSHFMPIIDGLIERDYGLNIAAFARVDNTKIDDLPKFKKAGLNWIELGIETGSKKVSCIVSIVS